MAPGVLATISAAVPEESCSCGLKESGTFVPARTTSSNVARVPEPDARLMTVIGASAPPTSLPVGDLAREDLLQVLELDVVDGHVGVDDRGHADDAHLVIGDLGDVGGILQLGLGEHVGVADLHGALRNLPVTP